MKNHEGKSIINAYEKLYNILATKVLKTCFQTPDNEDSNVLIQSIKDKNIEFKLVKPNMHRHNTDEQAIQTFKNHFIAGLYSVNTDLPLKLWDRLLDQTTTTLNLMRKSRINPNISTNEQLFGIFNFNHTPFSHQEQESWYTTSLKREQNRPLMGHI